MIRTRTSRTTMIDPSRAATMRDIIPPARGDVPERDTTVYTWPDQPARGRTPTMRLPIMGWSL